MPKKPNSKKPNPMKDKPKFDHEIRNRFSRFTIPHGIVGPHLKRPWGGFLVLLISKTVVL